MHRLASHVIRRGAARTARSLAVLVLICGLTSCDDADAPLEVVSVEVNGHGTLALSVPDEAIKAVVVYFHGADQAAPVIQTSAKHSAFFDPLLRAGYAVVTADADGNAYGNPASRQAYRDLITAAEAWFHAKATVFVAESMGALAALALLRDDSAHVVTAMVGITPLMGIPPYIRNVSFIDSPWGGRITNAADPMSWPASSFAHRNIRLYQAEQDRVIPRAATAGDFAKRFGADANIGVIPCAGGHVAEDCYQGDDVAAWLSGLAE